MAKRICMVAYTHYRTDARPRRTAEALVARGDQVYFLDLEKQGFPQTETINGVQVESLSTKRYSGSGKLNYLRSYLGFFYKVFRRINSMHLKERFDIIYLHTMPDFIVFTSIFAKLIGVRVVLDVHDAMPELYQSKFGVGDNHLFILALKLQEKLSCRFADHVICMHEPHRQLLESRNSINGAASIVMNLPDPSIFGEPVIDTLSINVHAPRLVYHGLIAYRAGLDLALHAFVKVKEIYPHARFDIYGTGDAAQDIQSLIQELHLGDSVSFNNALFPVPEIPAMLSGASVGIIPNRHDPATEVGLPVKLLEYLYCGIAVVAPKLDVIKHYFPADSIAYYSAGDVQSCAESICAVLGNPSRRNQQAAVREQFFKTFNWDLMKQQLYAAVDANSKR